LTSPSTAGRVKSKRSSFSYSKSLSWGSVDAGSFSSSPRYSFSTSAAILFKDARGLPVIQPLKSPSSRSSSIDDDILNFLKCYKCYDLIPSSGKLVVLDTKLSLKKAFYAMYESGVIACPLWRSETQKYVGLVTVDDFVKVLQKYYKGSLSKMDALDNKKLEELLQEESSNIAKDLEYVFPEASLYQAISSMITNKTHRLSILDPDTGNILYVLSQRELLKFLLHFVPNLQYFDHLIAPIIEVGVGTFTNIKTISKSTRVVEAVNLFVSLKVSSLPIVDSNGKIEDIFTKYDLLQMAASNTFSDLEVTTHSALENRKLSFEGVITCRGEDPVLSVIEKLVVNDVSQLVITDEEDTGAVVGMVTVTDILEYLVTVHRQSASVPSQAPSRRTSVARLRQRREDSIGEEVELEDEESGDSPELYKPSCSPPRWFNV